METMSSIPSVVPDSNVASNEEDIKHDAVNEGDSGQPTNIVLPGKNLEPSSKTEPEAASIEIPMINSEPATNHDDGQKLQMTRTDQDATLDPHASLEPHSDKFLPVLENNSQGTADQGADVNQLPAEEDVEAAPQQAATEISQMDQMDQIDNNATFDRDEIPNHEGATNLEIDSDETDSAIGDMTPISSTASLRSSIYGAVQENGRTYHRYKEGKYLLPNDEVEQERLDLQHHLCQLSLEGKNHLAPIGTDLQHVLDIGTGTGIWAIEFALQHPNTNVIGSDLSPIQPNFVPVNCRFEVDDAEDVWAYSHQFDFIHGRMLFSCFKDPAGVIASAFSSLEPGRYLEMMDVNFPFRCLDDSLKGTALGKWCSLLIEGAKALGKDWTCTSKYPKYFSDAGFVDVQVVNYHWPTNPWTKSEQQKILGRWLQQNLLDGVGAMSMAALTRGLKMSPAEVELFLIDVRNDIQDRHIHAYCPVDVVYGRKPE